MSLCGPGLSGLATSVVLYDHGCCWTREPQPQKLPLAVSSAGRQPQWPVACGQGVQPGASSQSRAGQGALPPGGMEPPPAIAREPLKPGMQRHYHGQERSPIGQSGVVAGSGTLPIGWASGHWPGWWPGGEPRKNPRPNLLWSSILPPSGPLRPWRCWTREGQPVLLFMVW